MINLTTLYIDDALEGEFGELKLQASCRRPDCLSCQEGQGPA